MLKSHKLGSKLEFREEIKIPLSWGHLAAKVWGSEDGVPVIALHGLLDNAGSFDTLAPLLPPDIHLICLDLCGHGNSSAYPPGVILHYFDHAYHLKQVVDHFKWEKVILIGHSVGAITAVTYAALFPETVIKLISLDIAKPFSVSVAKLPARLKAILTQMDGFLKQADDEPLTLTYRQARQTLIDNYKGSIDDKAADILLQRGLKRLGGHEDAYQFAGDLRVLIHTLTLSEDQIKVLLRQLSCPYMIILASEGLKNFTDETLREYLDIYRQSSRDFRLVQIDGTHHVHLTCPERVAPYINEFIKSPSPLPSSKL